MEAGSPWWIHGSPQGTGPCLGKLNLRDPPKPERFHTWWAGAVVADGSSKASAEGMLLATASCWCFLSILWKRGFFSLCSCYGGKKCVRKRALLLPVFCCLLAVPCWEGWRREICPRRGGDARQSVLGVCDSPHPCRCYLFPTKEFARKQKYIIKYFPSRLKLHLCSVLADALSPCRRVGALLRGIQQLCGYWCWWFHWDRWCHSESPSKGHLAFPCDKLLGV